MYAIHKYIIIIIGLISNVLTSIVLMRKRFKKFFTRNIILSLTMANTVKLTSIFLLHLTDFGSISIDLKYASELACGIQTYIDACTTAMSNFLITCLAITEYFLIKNSNIKYNTHLIILLVVSFVFIYTCTFPFLLSYNKSSFLNYTLDYNSSSLSNETKKRMCTAPLYSYVIEIVFSLLMPFLTTFLFSCLLIHAIYGLRQINLRLFSPQDRKKLKIKINLAFTTLIINFTYLLVNLPEFIHFILNKVYFDSKMEIGILNDLPNIGFFMILYIEILTNKIFREEFLCTFYCKTS